MELHNTSFDSLFRSLWSMRSYIHVNLCLSLMVAQLLFVVAVDKTGNKVYHCIVFMLPDLCTSVHVGGYANYFENLYTGYNIIILSIGCTKLHRSDALSLLSFSITSIW